MADQTTDQNQKKGRAEEIENQLNDLKDKAANAEGDARNEYERQMQNLRQERESLEKDLAGAEGLGKEIGGDLHL